MTSGERMPSPNSPMAVARIIAAEHRHVSDEHHPTLRHWRGSWMKWTGRHWIETEQAALRSELYKRLEGCHYLDKTGTQVGWTPNKTKVANLLEAISAVVHLPERINPPSWITPRAGDHTGPAVACANGLLDIASRTLQPLTPRYLNTVSVPLDYTTGAAEPTRWIEFLEQLWADDPDSVAALQEWFGYILSGRTDLQKIMLLVGPTRSGKGTIARVLAQLVGNVAGPTLLALGGDFGLASLLDKPLAIISDARLGRGHHVHVVVERLLSISGEDILDVNRKYREPWTGKLGTRLMILSNELPQLGDESGAIAGRLVVLSMTESFLGREDALLYGDLLDELPGILEWSLVGLDRLIQQGRFTEPAASQDAARTMRDLVSPIGTFVRDHCEIGPHTTPIDDLWSAWKTWAEDNGVPKSTKQWFGRGLRSAVPSLREVRLRPPNEELGPQRSAQGSAQGPHKNTRQRAYKGLRLSVDSPLGPQRSAQEQETYAYAREAPQEALEGVDSTMEKYADLRGPSECKGCGEADGDHIPGCPETTS